MMTHMLNKKIGENIRAYRMMSGFSQGRLAKMLGVDNSYISTLESGARNPSVNTLAKVADSLNIPVASLMESSVYGSVRGESPALPYVRGLIASKEQEWKGKTWYHQRFDGSPYLLHMIGEAEIKTRRDTKYGLFFNRHFCFFEDGKADWYIDMADIERVSGIVLHLSQQYPHFGRKLMKEYEPLEKTFHAECEKVGKARLHALSNSELIGLHDEFIQSVLDRNSSSSDIDGFALGTDKLLEERIRKVYGAHPHIAKVARFSEVFSALTTPSHSSFVRDAELAFFKLILQVRSRPTDKKRLIREYRDRFFWMKNNYIDAHVLSIDHFESEIARIESSGLNVVAEIKRIETLPRENKKKKDTFLKTLDMDPHTLSLLVMTEDFTQWQDERKKATMLTAHYATILLDEISRRIDIDSGLLKYLSPREVSRIFIDTPPVALLEKRREYSVLYWDVDGHEILNGGVVLTIKKKLLGEKPDVDVQDFRGMTASLGKAQGRVKVLKSVHEIGRIEHGDILVAVMTRPDYVPAMKKAAAIITDEGGITSHAAIVSRELQIPCIIGTKIATQILRDGDLVQVNANHGLVRILERATTLQAV